MSFKSQQTDGRTDGQSGDYILPPLESINRQKTHSYLVLFLELQSINDIQLFALTGGLAAVVLVVLITWECVGPHEAVVRFLVDEVSYIINDGVIL